MFRSVVLPVLRLVVWTVIALSLAWLAFGRADPVPDTVAAPSFAAAVPETVVSRGTVENKLRLDGSVAADPATPVKTTANGRVTRLRVRVGDAVGRGAPLLDVVTETETPARTETPGRPGAAGPAPAEAAVPPPAAAVKKTTTVVRAPAAGTVTAVDVLTDQQVAVGDAVASVRPGTLTVSASLTQQQQFRLLTPPTVADVTVPGGPAPFRCEDVRVGEPEPAEAPAGAAPSGPSGAFGASGVAGPATGSITCRVPAGATVFAGMSATVELLAGSATDVLVLPVTAVQGAVGTGTVWVPRPDGEPVERTVQLGLTDGERVEVRSGLAEGDRVLQFVPNSDQQSDPGGGAMPGRMGG